MSETTFVRHYIDQIRSDEVRPRLPQHREEQPARIDFCDREAQAARATPRARHPGTNTMGAEFAAWPRYVDRKTQTHASGHLLSLKRRSGTEGRGVT